MCSGLRNYKQKGNPSKRFVYGADYFLDDKTESPFRVDMPPLVRRFIRFLFLFLLWSNCFGLIQFDSIIVQFLVCSSVYSFCVPCLTKIDVLLQFGK